MAEVAYRGLEPDGVAMVGMGEKEFARRLAIMRECSSFPVPELDDAPAAMLVNNTGQTILAFVAVWRYFEEGEESHRRTVHTLCSGAQFEALCGRGGVAPGNSLFVLPGSQRLITEESIHGDNNDVLPADRRTRGNSGWGGSNRGRGQWTVITRVVAELDVVILSDGRVLGPDSLGTVEGLEREMEAERTLACAMAGSMRAGATPGALFDMLREFATEPPGQSGALREMFVQHAVFLLLRHSRDGILAWLDDKAEPPLLSLQRALR